MSVQGRWADVLRGFLKQNEQLEDFGSAEFAEEEKEEEKRRLQRVACSSLTSDAADSVTHSELDEMLLLNRDLAGILDDPSPSSQPSSSASPRLPAPSRLAPSSSDSAESAAQRRRRGLEEKIAKFNELQQKRREIQRLRSTESLDKLPNEEDGNGSPGFIEIYDTRRRNLPADGSEVAPRRVRRHRDHRRHSTLSTISSDDEGAMHRLSEYEPGPGVYTEPPSRQSGHIQMHPYLRSSFEQLYEPGFAGKMAAFGSIDVLSADWMREEEEEEEELGSSGSAASFVQLPSKMRRSGSSGDSTPRADSGEEEEEVRRRRAGLERAQLRVSGPPAKESPQPPKRRSLPSVEEAELRRRSERAQPSKVPKLRTAEEPKNFVRRGSGEKALARPGPSLHFAEARSSFETASQASSDAESGHSFIHRPSAARPPVRLSAKVEEEKEEAEEAAQLEAEKDRLHSRFYAWSHSRPQHELDTLERSHGSKAFGMDVRLTQRSSLEFRTGQDPGLQAAEAPVIASAAAGRQRAEVRSSSVRRRADVGAKPAAFDAFVGLLRDEQRCVPPLDLRQDSSEAEESAEEAWVKLEPRGSSLCEKRAREDPVEVFDDGGRVTLGTPGYVGRREGPQGREGSSGTEGGQDDPRAARMQHRGKVGQADAARKKPVGEEENVAGWGKVGHEMREAPMHDYWVRDRPVQAEEVTRLKVGQAESRTEADRPESLTESKAFELRMGKSEAGHGMVKAELGQSGGHVGVSRGEVGRDGRNKPEVGHSGISRSAVGRVAMPRGEVGQTGITRNVGYIKQGHAEPPQRESGHAEPPQREVGHAEPSQREVGHAEPPQREVGHAEPPQREVGHFRSASVGPPLPPRQSQGHQGARATPELHSQPHQLRQLLHGRPDQVLRSTSFQQNRATSQNGRLPSQEQREGHIRPSAQGHVFESPPEGQIRASAQGRTFASPNYPQEGHVTPGGQGQGQAFTEFPQGHVSGRKVNGSAPPQSPVKADARFQGHRRSGEYSHTRLNTGHAQLRVSNSFNGQIGSSGHYQGQIAPGGRFQNQMRLSDHSRGPMRSSAHLQGQTPSGSPPQGQVRSTDHFQGQMRSADHPQGQVRSTDQFQGQMRSADHLQGQMRSTDQFQGQVRSTDHFQGQSKSADNLQRQINSGDHFQGRATSMNPLQGQMRSADHLQVQMRSPDHLQGQMRSTGHLQGQMRSADHLPSQMRSADLLQGQMRSPDHLQGQSRSADHLSSQMRSDHPLQSQMRSADHLQGQMRSADHLQGQLRSADHLQGQMKSTFHLQGQMKSPDHLQGQMMSPDHLQGQMKSPDHLQGQMKSPDHVLQGQMKSPDPLQGQLKSPDHVQGQIKSPFHLQGQVWPHEHFQARMSQAGGLDHSRPSQGPVMRSVRPSDLRSQSFNEDDLRLHPRRPSSRARSSAALQRHHSSVTAAPPTAPPPLPPRQRPDTTAEAPPASIERLQTSFEETDRKARVEAPRASLERLRTAFEEADRKARAGAAPEDDEAHRDDFWREMATLERQERAGFAWDDDEDAWVTDAVKEEQWKVLKDPGDRQDPVAELERMFLDLDLDRDDLMEKAERRIVPVHMLDRLNALKEEEEGCDQMGPLSPSMLPSASPLPGPSGASTLQSHASTTRSYNHIPHRAPFPHRVRDDKAFRRLHPNVQAPTVSRRASSLSSGANSGFVSGMATPAEAPEEKGDGKLRSASSVRTRAEPSPTSADYLLPRESGTLQRRKQWPPPFAEDPDPKVDDMAYRRLVQPARATKPQKDLLGKPRPTPFSEDEAEPDSNGKGGGKQTWWPYARVHELKRQEMQQDTDEEVI